MAIIFFELNNKAPCLPTAFIYYVVLLALPFETIISTYNNNCTNALGNMLPIYL